MKKIMLCFISCLALFGLTGCDSVEDNAIYEIENDIREQNYSLGYGTTYTIGKVKSAKCSISENDQDYRILLNCTIKYNPKLNNGTTDLTKEMDDDIVAMYIQSKSSSYVRMFGSTSQIESLKSSVCWGKEVSAGYDC